MHNSLPAMLYLCTGIIVIITIIMEHTIAPLHGHKLCGHTQNPRALLGSGEGTTRAALSSSRHRTNQGVGSSWPLGQHLPLILRTFQPSQKGKSQSKGVCHLYQEENWVRLRFSARGLRTEGCSVATSTPYADDRRGEEKCNRPALLCEFH